MSKPLFMSPAHVDEMNAILRDAPEAATACQGLDRRYAVCYDLSDGPSGTSVHWSMEFDPEAGVRMGLKDIPDADLTIVGDWSDAIKASRAQRRGEEYEAGLKFQGDPDVLETVGPAFAAAQQVATVDVSFPELSGE